MSGPYPPSFTLRPLHLPINSTFLIMIKQGVNAGLEDVYTLYNELNQNDNDLEKGRQALEEFLCLLLYLIFFFAIYLMLICNSWGTVLDLTRLLF